MINIRLHAWVLSCALLATNCLEAQGENPSQAARAPLKEVKLLTIGNSFTGNASGYLPKLAMGGGKKLTLFVAAIGGYTLEEHVKRLQAYEANPQDPAGRPYENKRSSLREALEKQAWDVVAIQQSSVHSMRPETFQPSTNILIDSIHKYAPHAKILLFETWAYPDDYYSRVPELKLDRPAMYAKVKAAYQKISEETGLPIIPVGDAFQTVAKLEHPIVLTNPNDKHCNNQGRYLAGAVFYEAIFQDSVEGNSFVPPGMSPEEAKTLLNVAHKTVTASPIGGAPGSTK